MTRFADGFLPPRRTNRPESFEVVNNTARAVWLERLLDKFQMHGMDLVIILHLFVGKDQIQCHLIRLIDNRSVAGGHFPDVKALHARDGLQIFLGTRYEFFSGIRLVAFGPENDNV